MYISIAQLNPTVGDIPGNSKKILLIIEQVKKYHGPGLIVFPELIITGYPPEDLLLRPSFLQQTQSALEEIIGSTADIDIILGHPEMHDSRIYNCCSLISNGHIAATYRKKKLPNYGVFDERRYFEPGDKTPVFDFQSVPAAMSICEDLWSPEHAAEARDAGAKLLININASPYHINKQTERIALLKQRINETGMTIVYVNMVGGQDELVFDGASMIMDSSGEIVFQAPQFQEGHYIVELKETGTGSGFKWKKTIYDLLDNEPAIYQALVLGVRDYVHKNGFKGAVIGLSGGIDSALTLAIAVDALGNDNVEVLLMPSRYTADISNADAREMAENLKIKYHIVPIEKPFTDFTEILSPIFKNMPVNTTEENIQARCRGILLMAVSNKTGRLVLTTGNKSEMSVGYATLYGDMAGGFAPLKDVSKTLVYALANWRNGQNPVIPQRIIDRPPSAELKPDQKDEDVLPPYDILDPILERYIELDQSPDEIIGAGFKKETVHEIIRLVDRNEYKRRQAPPGVKITKRAFGRDRRYPITSGYKEY